MKHNLKLLGLCLALALLCAGLFVGSALADDNPLIIDLPNKALLPNDDLTVRIINPDENGEYGVSIEKLIENGTEDATPAGITKNGNDFTVPMNALELEPARGYLATVVETVNGLETRRASEPFVLFRDDTQGYGVDLTVNGRTDGIDVLVNQRVDMLIEAEGAERVWLYCGGDREIDLSYFNDKAHIEYRKSWERAARGMIYARAEYRIPYTDRTISILSNPVSFVASFDENIPLPAPVLSCGDSVRRGELLAVTVGNNGTLPVGTSLLLYIKDAGGNRVYEDEFGSDAKTILVPTACIKAGKDYKLGGYWLAEGRDHLEAVEKTVEVTASGEDSLMVDVPDNTTVVPHHWYTLSGYLPGEEGVCLFLDGKLVEDSQREGEDSIIYYDSRDRKGTYTYTLGYLDVVDKEKGIKYWKRTRESVTIEVGEGETLPALGLTVTVTRNGEAQLLSSGAIVRRDDQIAVTLPALNDGADYTAYGVWYDVRVADVFEGRDEIYQVGDRADKTIFFTLPEDGSGFHFEPGHEYVITAQAHTYGYRVQEAEVCLMALEDGVNPNDDTCKVELVDTADTSFAPNQDIKVKITAPADAQAFELYTNSNWDYYDRWVRKTEGEDENKKAVWEGVVRLDAQGNQIIMARATKQNVREDDFDWHDVDWDYYSPAVAVTVNDGQQAILPEISIKAKPQANSNNPSEVPRGKFASVTLQPEYNDQNKDAIEEILKTVSGIRLEVQKLDMDSYRWEYLFDDERGGEDFAPENLKQSWNLPFDIPTANLEPGPYRVIVTAYGKEGYHSTRSWEEDRDHSFLVMSGGDYSHGLMAFGYGVEETETSGVYTAPTANSYFISGFFEGQRDLGLFEGEHCVGTWFGGEDSFTWRCDEWDDAPATHVYTMRKWDDEKDEWVDIIDGHPVSITINVVAEKDEQGNSMRVGDPVVSVETRIDENTTLTNAVTPDKNFTISFPAVEYADWYYAELRMREADRDKIQWEYISKDELPDGVTFEDGTFTITHNIKNLGIKEGDFCEIHVSAYHVGYITGNGDINVPVVNGTPNAGVTLEVVSPNTEEGEDLGKFYINQEFELKITTDDADDVDEVQVFMDGDWEYMDVNENDVEGDVITLHRRAEDVGTQQLRARVRKDNDDEWSGASAAVEVYFNTKGTIELPTITLAENRNNLTAGDMLGITFGALREADAPHARGYRLEVYDAEGNDRWDEHDSVNVDIFEQGGTYYYSTANLEPGKYYCLSVEMETEDCYGGGETDRDDEKYWFYVGEPSGITGDYEIRATKTEVDTGEEFTITGFTLKEDCIAIWEDGAEEWDKRYSDGRQTVSLTDFWMGSGTHTYRLYKESGNGNWEAVEDKSVEVTVTASKETGENPSYLDAPVIAVEKQDGGDYKLTVTFAEEASRRWVRVYRNWDRSNPVYENHEPGNENIIPADKLVPGEAYNVVAWNGEPGYNAKSSEKGFVAIGNQGGDYTLRLTVDGNSDNAELVSNQNENCVLNFKVSPANATAPTLLQVFWEGDYRNINGYSETILSDSGYSCEDFSPTQSGEWTVVARATWENPEGKPWKELNWVYSNPVEVKVTSNGGVSLPTSCSILPNALNMGDEAVSSNKLTLHIENLNTLRSEGVKNLRIRISRCDIDRYEEYYFKNESIEDGSDDSKDIEIPLNELHRNEDNSDPLRPGQYWVQIEVPGPAGKDSAWTDWDEDMCFTVKSTLIAVQAEKVNDEWVELEKDEHGDYNVLTGQVFRFIAETPDGVKCRINEWGDGVSENGHIECEALLERAGDYTFSLSYWDEDDEEWKPLPGGPTVTVHANTQEDAPELSEPELVTVPATVSEDATSFTFTFKEVANAASYFVWVGESMPQDENTILNQGFGAGSANLPNEITYGEGVYTVTIDTEKFLTAGNKLSITVRADNPGSESKFVWRAVPVVAGDDPENWLTVTRANGGELTGVQSREPLNYHVAIPPQEGKQPQVVEIFMDEEWIELGEEEGLLDYNPSDYSSLDFTCDRLEGGMHTVLLRATWGNPDDDNWTYGNPVTVSVTGSDIPMPKVSLTTVNDEPLPNGKIPCGAQLKLNFQDVSSNVKSYHVRFYRVDDNYDDCFFVVYPAAPENGEDSILAPTAGLNEGEYAVSVWFEPEVGYNSRGIDERDENAPRFTVKSSDVATFKVNKTTVETKEGIVLSAYVPGARGLRIKRDPMDNPDDDIYYSDQYGDNDDNDERIVVDDLDIGRRGKYKFTLEQENGRDWVKVEREGLVNPIEVDVTSKGSISSPVIGVPAVAYKQDSGNFTFDVSVDVKDNDGAQVETVPFLNVEVWEYGEHDDDDEPVLKTNNTTQRQFSIPWSKLDANKTYEVQVYVWLPGYDCEYDEQQFEVMTEPTEGSPSIELKVNENTDTANVNSRTDYTLAFKIKNQGTYVPTGFEIKWEDGWEALSQGDWGEFRMEYDDINDQYTYTRSDDPCVRNLAVRARFQGIDAPIVSNTVKVVVTATGGQVPEPGVTLENLGEGKIVQGTPLQVKIALDAKKDTFKNISNIDLNVKGFDDQGNFDEQIFHMDVLKGAPTLEEGEETYTCTVQVPTTGLDVGARYRVEIWVGAAEGYISNQTDEEDKKLWFTVAGNSEVIQDAPTLSVGAEQNAEGVYEVQVNKNFVVSGRAPQEQRLALFVDGEKVEQFNENSFNTNIKVQDAGEHTLALGVWQAGDWRVLNGVDGACATVTATRIGTLGCAAITAGNLTEDEDFSFTVDSVSGAEGYFVHVHGAEKGGWQNRMLVDKNYTNRDFVNSVLTVTIPWSKFAALTTPAAVGETFEIFVSAWADGYESGISSETFTIVPTPVQGKTVEVTMPGSDSIKVNQQVEIGIKLNTTGGETISTAEILFDGRRETLEKKEGEGNAYLWSWDGYFTGTEVTANATIIVTDSKNVETYSDRIPVTITRDGTAKLEVELSSNKPLKGESLTVTIGGENLEHAENVKLDVYAQGNNPPIDDIISYNEQTAKATIDTGALAPGRYRVRVEAEGEVGYSSWNSDDDDNIDLSFTVKRPEAKFTIEPAEVKIGDNLAVTAYLDNAKTYSIVSNGETVAEKVMGIGEVIWNGSVNIPAYPGVYIYELVAKDKDGNTISHNFAPVEIIVEYTGNVENPDSLSKFVLPAKLEKIEEEAFSGLGVVSVIIPDGCKSIGKRAFADCKNLQYVLIPKSVTSIAPDAFADCTSLTTIVRQ